MYIYIYISTNYNICKLYIYIYIQYICAHMQLHGFQSLASSIPSEMIISLGFTLSLASIALGNAAGTWLEAEYLPLGGCRRIRNGGTGERGMGMLGAGSRPGSLENLEMVRNDEHFLNSKSVFDVFYVFLDGSTQNWDGFV